MNNNNEQVLISFNGLQDPLNKRDEDGPVLSLLRERDNFFTRVVLFSNQNNSEKAQETSQMIENRFTIPVLHQELDLVDPTNYSAILQSLREVLPKLCPPLPPPSEYFISIASGTSQIHNCWFLLAASGELQAKLLHIRELAYATGSQSLITEINPNAAEFPKIRTSPQVQEVQDISSDELRRIIEEVGIIGSNPQLKKALKNAAKAAQFNKVSEWSLRPLCV